MMEIIDLDNVSAMLQPKGSTLSHPKTLHWKLDRRGSLAHRVQASDV